MYSIFGFSGFVGSNLTTMFEYDNLYNRKNIQESKYKHFDIIHLCCVPAVKWKANKFPEEDEQQLKYLKSIFKTIKANKVVLISTIDVYHKIDGQENEDHVIEYNNNHTYGKNRFLFEKFILETFKDVHILRLPALFGRGLKKNILYDLLNNNNVHKIDKTSKFQWYNLEWLKDDIEYVIEKNIRICNLFTEPLETSEILGLFNYNYQDNPSIGLSYNIISKYFDRGYIKNKFEVLSSIKEFINIKQISSNLCISNISNCLKNNHQYYNILRHYGFKKIELALTKYGDWDSVLNTDLIEKEINIMKEFGLTPCSVQSITYNLKYNIFSDEKDRLLDHIKKVINMCLKYNITNIVFGCPRNRIIKDKDERVIFIDFFRDLGKFIGERNTIISIENNSKKYDCNFLNTISEVGDIVREIDNKNIQMMVDIGNCEMENDNLDDIVKYRDIINHVHYSEPFMEEIHSTKPYFMKILRSINYEKVISFEFLSKCIQDLNNSIIKSI